MEEKKLIEDEVDDITRVTAAMMLTQAKLKKDGAIIKQIAEKKGYNGEDFANKLSAMMISYFLKNADVKTANAVLNDMQSGHVNRTFESYINISYESVGKDLSMTEEENEAWTKVRGLVKEANKDVEFYESNKQKSSRVITDEEGEVIFEEDLTWAEHFMLHKKLWALIAISVLIPAIYIGILIMNEVI